MESFGLFLRLALEIAQLIYNCTQLGTSGRYVENKFDSVDCYRQVTQR